MGVVAGRDRDQVGAVLAGDRRDHVLDQAEEELAVGARRPTGRLTLKPAPAPLPTSDGRPVPG